MAEITVYDFPGFKSALSDPGYDIIHLGNDITYASGGVIVPRSKGNILIDGHNFTITDYNSAVLTDTIRYPDTSGSPFTFTLQNVVWSGKNFFGTVYTPATSNFSNFTLVLKNMQYTGPQPVYNRMGTTYYIDSVFNLERNAGASVPEELGEVHHAVIQGKVNVTSQSTTTSVLWFLNPSASLTVDENAEFNVSIPGSYMFYTDGTPPPAMLFKANSKITISTRWGLFYSTSATAYIASSFTLEQGASFTSTQTDRRATPTFKCQNSFTMEDGSSLYITAEPSGISALMYFSARATLNFNNPKSVVLYNNGGNVFQFATGTTALPNTININTELLNMWTTATLFPNAGGFDDTPTRALAKADGSNIVATLYTTTTATSAINTNIQTGDTGEPMNPTTFNVMQAKVISMGNLKLTANEITDQSTAITGTTEPLANLRASYNSTLLTGTADAAGAIDLPVSSPIPSGETVYLGTNWKFLTKYIKIIAEGTVTITYLPPLLFKTFLAPCRKNMIKRKDPNWYLEVTDTRQSGPDWSLYVYILAPMHKDIDTLDNAFTYNSASSFEVLSSTPLFIKQVSFTEKDAITKITWSELEGFLLRVNPDSLYHPGKYNTTMYWEIRIES